MVTNQTPTEQYSLVAGQLRSARRVLAVAHIVPDGDALGSLCFFKELMDSLGKDCTMYCAGLLPKSLDFLKCWSDIMIDKTKINFSEFDLIVSLDCATPSRTSLETEIFNRRKDQIFLEIDHHPTSRKLSDFELRLTKAASTTEVLFGLASFMKIELTPTMAQSLLTGIVTDTGNFIYDSATKATIAAAAKTIQQGANLLKISNQTSKTKTLVGLKVWGLALSRLIHNKKYNLIYTILTADDLKKLGADEEVLEGISGLLSSLNEGKVALMLYESKGLIKGSLRSIDKNVNVARLAGIFGGGGHVLASGFVVKGNLALNNGKWHVAVTK